MEIFEKFARVMTRRSFLGRASTGIGSMALASCATATSTLAT